MRNLAQREMKINNCWLIILVFLTSPLWGQSAIQLPDVVASAGIIQRTIKIDSESASLRSQANALFKLHGGFKQTGTARDADFAFQFSPVGLSGVKVIIQSGNQTLWQGQFDGASRQKSLMQAADTCVEKTLGIPGFFSSQIAFISSRSGHAEVFLSDMLFSSVKQLTRDRNQCLSPEISPDGNTILYTSYHGTGFPDIYKINLVTGRRTVFAGFKGTNTGAAFDPQGRSVAMILSGSGNSELFVANASGGQLRRLTTRESLESDPSWSPDGSRIVLTSDQLGQPQIYTVQSNGRQFRRVQTNISRNCSEPTWNPRNADQIAFTAAVASEFEICVYEFSKDKSTILSKGSGDAVHPEWLNDGRHLIYTHRTPKFTRLMVLDTLTGSRAVLSPADMNNASQASVYYPQ